jgi:hypothetical protein
LLVLVSVAACGGGGTSAVRPTRPISLEARKIQAVDWAKRDPAAPLWPDGTRRLQVVITQSGTAGQSIVWFVVNGTKPYRVFRISDGELPALFAELHVNLTRATVRSPLASLWDGGGGSVPTKPTPDPGPSPIFPETYVDQVMNIAWDMSTQVVPEAAGP